MALPVVSQPNNVPTLAPTVAPAPQNQPTLAPQVQSAPAAPQPVSLPVQSAPAQQHNLPVENQPANQQQSLAVQLPPIVTAIQTAINRGADPSSILQAISRQNPQQGTAIQTALSRGATPQQVLTEIVNQNSGITPQSPQQHVGFVQSLIQSIARPFLRPLVGLYNAGAATVKGIEGDSQAGLVEANKTRDLGYFGQVKPTMLKSIGQGAGKSFLDTGGTGAELAANFVGAEGAVGAGEDLIKGAAGAAVKAGIKQGAISGGLAGFGSSLEENNPSIGNTITKTLEGTIGGGVTGGVLTGLPALAISTSKAIRDTISPSVETALTKAIKPAKNNTGWFDALKNVVPDIQETARLTKTPINNLDDLANVIKQTKDRFWQSYQDILDTANARANPQSIPANTIPTAQKYAVLQLESKYGSTLVNPRYVPYVDGNKIADAMVNSLDERTITQNPQKFAQIFELSQTYRKPLTFNQAEDFLQSSNNELYSYYAKNKVSQKVAASDPDVAPVLAEANALRDALYTKLNALTGDNAAILKKKYGDLTNIQNEVIGRKNVVARQNPDTLAEQLSYAQAGGKILKSVVNMKFGDAAEGAAQAVTSHLLKQKNSTDSLIQSAFSR